MNEPFINKYKPYYIKDFKLNEHTEGTLQTFLKMDDISQGCLNEIDSKKPSFIPQRWEKVYKDWVENITT